MVGWIAWRAVHKEDAPRCVGLSFGGSGRLARDRSRRLGGPAKHTAGGTMNEPPDHQAQECIVGRIGAVAGEAFPVSAI